MPDESLVTAADSDPETAAAAPPAGRSRRRATIALLVSLTVLVLGWIIVLPPSSGADEPSHVRRSAALVRGQLDDEGVLDVIFTGSYELPAWVGWPPPQCWAFKLDVPVSCSTLLDEPVGEELLGTRSANYPIWGHLLPGLPTLLVDNALGNRLARVAHALAPLALLGAALVLAARRSRLAAAGVLLAATPTALANTATVNPSGLVIMGGLGLWTVLALGPPDSVTRSRLASWLAVASWAAMVLPRRDGLFYATVILAIVLLLGLWTPAQFRRLLSNVQLGVVAAVLLATCAWAITSDSTVSRMLVVTPLIPPFAFGLRILVRRSKLRGIALAGVTAAASLLVTALAVIWVQRRDPLLDTVKWRDIVAETGSDLFEAVGVLGWLDAPMPASMMFLYVGAIGAVVGGVALVAPRRLGPPALVLTTAILMSWWFTATQAGGSPEYWQGRYYLPLLAGVPILLTATPELRRFERTDSLARALGVVAAVVSVVALGAAMRRFAVGIDGTMAPWRWHTFGAAVSPLFPMVLIVLAWGALLWSVDRVAGTSAIPDAPEHSGDGGVHGGAIDVPDLVEVTDVAEVRA